jgi:hypothetical protein
MSVHRQLRACARGGSGLSGRTEKAGDAERRLFGEQHGGRLRATVVLLPALN